MQMEGLKSTLPDPSYRQFKYLTYELLGILEREEWDKLEGFSESVSARLQDALKLGNKLKEMAESLRKDQVQGVDKLRMRMHFLDRLKSKMTDEQVMPEAFKLAFPLGETPPKAAATIPKQGKKQKLRQKKAPLSTPVNETEPPDTKPLPEKKGHLLDTTKTGQAAHIKSDQLPEQSKAGVLESSPAKNEVAPKAVAPTPEAPPKETKKKTVFAKKDEIDPKKAAYYKERKERLQDYIKEDQKRGRIDVKPPEELDER